jgi:hypothetical protein
VNKISHSGTDNLLSMHFDVWYLYVEIKLFVTIYVVFINDNYVTMQSYKEYITLSTLNSALKGSMNIHELCHQFH